jgi:hypothetical protein
VTERVRIFAAAGLVAVLALGGGFLLLGRGQSSPSAAPVIKPLHPVKHGSAPTPKPVQKKKVLATPKASPKPKPKPKPGPARTPPVIDGMPSALALALRSSPVAVVALYTPGSSVDELARAEAQAGAQEAGVAFVPLDVSSEKVAAPLTSLLTGGASAADRVLDDPAVLIFKRPKALYIRLSGWNDRDTVAQAVANALNGT